MKYIYSYTMAFGLFGEKILFHPTVFLNLLIVRCFSKKEGLEKEIHIFEKKEGSTHKKRRWYSGYQNKWNVEIYKSENKL